MICFRDMTFCQFHASCRAASECHRPLTPEVEIAAREWWEGEGDPPIAVFDGVPECHKPVGGVLGIQLKEATT